jgi:chromosome segregation ATPase
MKKKTVIDYGSDNGDYKDGSESFKKPDYYLELNNKKQEIKNLESRKDNLGNEIKNLNRADANYDANYKLKTEELSEVETKIKQAQNEYDYIKKLNDEFITAQKKLVFYYFNLKTMKSEKIENIDANILNEEKFKYILVDDNNNKLPYDETSRDLIKFTKIYSKNEKYNINIINDIIYAKNNREKLFI